MNLIDLAYTVFITLALCATYGIILELFPRLFVQERSTSLKNPLPTLFFIIIFSTLSYTVSIAIPDPSLSNRVLHVFGGGFLAFAVSFLAARDSQISINKFQLLVISTLISLALGVANELLEFILQSSGLVIAARNVDDTWFDLASNTIGIILASIIFVPLHKEIDYKPRVRT